MTITRNAKIVCILAAAVLLAGCLGANDDGPDPAPADAPEEEDPVAPETRTHQSRIDVSFGTPLVSFNYGGEDTYSTSLPMGDNTTGFVLELHWTPESPFSQELDLWIRDAAMGTIPPDDPLDLLQNQPHLKATGSSPLRLAFAADDLEDIAYSILVRANSDPGGIAIEQPFALHIVTFDGIPFDPEHAIEA